MANIVTTDNGIFSPQYLKMQMIGGIKELTDERLTLDNPYDSPKYMGVYTGKFDSDKFGNVNGTIDEFTFFYRDSSYTQIQMWDLNASASKVMNLIEYGSINKLLSYLLRGNDTVDVRLYEAFYGSHIVNGFKGNDTLIAGRGDDVLDGGSGNDRLYGGNGSDTLSGGDGRDFLEGSVGGDTLVGNAGSDILKGGGGADKLIGGTGKDVMFAGYDKARDVFVFNSIKDSGSGKARDVIRDYESGTDEIDLLKIDADASAAGNQNFIFNEISSAAHAVWYVDIGKDILVRGDVSGDGKADFVIQLANLNSVSASDFIL